MLVVTLCPQILHQNQNHYKIVELCDLDTSFTHIHKTDIFLPISVTVEVEITELNNAKLTV